MKIEFKAFIAYSDVLRFRSIIYIYSFVFYSIAYSYPRYRI